MSTSPGHTLESKRVAGQKHGIRAQTWNHRPLTTQNDAGTLLLLQATTVLVLDHPG